ncbi:hypothetical protein ACFFTM_17305 [Pseudoduganella plicata]|uniref:CheW-like domain-containing protein n=1 Tax=Pseudoduganella plicata TaxID=321984 RepID=A0A4P7B980_9BURK|nr:hypothetical protein [Pseudoduganella plicata]QBQ35056.1 hypothetical protein E1742_01865 [Pseudoduganella plicata]GGZ09889.1 hypothetical protein GCM10007388_49190 [Pseudoduganella plicata]
MLVPVADLARRVETGPPTVDSAARRVLVLRADGRSIGLPAAAVARLHHDDDPNEVFQPGVQVPDSGTAVGILEAARLVAPGLCVARRTPIPRRSWFLR